MTDQVEMTPEQKADAELLAAQNAAMQEPPHKFSVGQRVSLPDGAPGKVSSVSQDETGAFVYGVETAQIVEFQEHSLTDAEPKFEA